MIKNQLDFVQVMSQHGMMRDYKYIRVLSMAYMTFLLAATVVAYRIVQIGPVPEPGSTLIYTFSFFISNTFAECYGYEKAKKLIWESIFCGYLFAVLLAFVSLLPAPPFWDNTNAYEQVLGHVFRFTNAGVVGYLISAFINIRLVTRWKYRMNGKWFWLRSLLAASISEGAATFITGFLTFLGMLSTRRIFIVMSCALLFKIVYGFLAVIPASFLAFILKKKELAGFLETTQSNSDQIVK